MTAFTLVFVLGNAVALLSLPRRWAHVPVLVGTCYVTLGQGIELGAFTFTVIRLLVAVGVVRVIIRRERLQGGPNQLDWLIVIWALWACLSSGFHEEPWSALVYRLGLAYNACGIYFLLRVFCSSVDDVVQVCRTIAVVLTLVALAMLYERAELHNIFSVFGGVPDTPTIREGSVRASGPFAHPILAGTVGAVTLPLMIALRQSYPATAALGTVVCLTMVVASASSGPIMSAAFAVGPLMMWRLRSHMRLIRGIVLCGSVALSLVMNAPVYYLIARVDIVGGSTGWYRSRLMESAFEHLNEWWLAGTDYTLHWMPDTNAVDQHHVDITNYYLRMGVLGGLPMILLFIAVLATAFSFVGTAARADSGNIERRQQFMAWALGCALFAHAATFVSVSYFDQSVVFLYFTLAAIGSAHARTKLAVVPQLNGSRLGARPRSLARRSFRAPARSSAQTPIHKRGRIRTDGR